MIAFHTYKIVWIDIYHDTDWLDFDKVDKSIKENSNTIESVGYFIKETDDFYVFTSGVDKTDEKYFDIVLYPKGVVKLIIEICEKEQDARTSI